MTKFSSCSLLANKSTAEHIPGVQSIKREYNGSGGSSNLSITMAPLIQHVENLGTLCELPSNLSSIQCSAPQKLHKMLQRPELWRKEVVFVSWDNSGLRAIGNPCGD